MSKTKTVLQEKRSTRNKPRIIAALVALGYELVTIEYRGQDDSGGGYEFSYKPRAENKINSTIVEVEVREPIYNEVTREWSSITRIKPISLIAALENFADDLISENGHSGFENNEGGGGEINIHLATGSYEHYHYDNILDLVEHNYEG